MMYTRFSTSLLLNNILNITIFTHLQRKSTIFVVLWVNCGSFSVAETCMYKLFYNFIHDQYYTYKNGRGNKIMHILCSL